VHAIKASRLHLKTNDAVTHTHTYECTLPTLCVAVRLVDGHLRPGCVEMPLVACNTDVGDATPGGFVINNSPWLDLLTTVPHSDCAPLKTSYPFDKWNGPQRSRQATSLPLSAAGLSQT